MAWALAAVLWVVAGCLWYLTVLIAGDQPHDFYGKVAAATTLVLGVVFAVGGVALVIA
jgi:hypothetical protein